MARHIRFLIAIVATIIVLSAAAIGWTLTQVPSNHSEPNLPTNSAESTPPMSTYAATFTATPTATQVLSPSPTETIPSTPLSPSPSILTPTPSPTPTTAPILTPTPTLTPTEPPTAPPSNSIENGLELSISLEKTIYNLGEPVNVTLTITNTNNLTTSFTHTGMDFDFIVYNGTYNIIYQWSIGRAFPQFVAIETLQPGENVTQTDIWPQTINYPQNTSSFAVSPGTYYIVGKSNSIYGLSTDPVQITILGS